MRQIFRNDARDRQFQEDGYVVVDLLGDADVSSLWSFYDESFPSRREVVPYARGLPYYISIFDSDNEHKRQVDARISDVVAGRLGDLMVDYGVFYSNFMIKFPGDGPIEAHQDFNFVDESRHTAFNLWCPLVDTDAQNGGLFVISGSHRVFRTQRGPNLPKALTEYHDTLRKYARRVPLAKGQAIIFDHRLIHYSTPNRTDAPRVAVQSVLTPCDATPIHYAYDATSGRVRAYRIDKEFILQHNLWDTRLDTLTLDHEQALIPFPTPDEVTTKLAELTVRRARPGDRGGGRPVFRQPDVQSRFERDGFVVLPVLGPDEVTSLTQLFVETTGGHVANTDYGMYIGLEDPDLARKKSVIDRIAAIVVPTLERHFADCKPHLGSFLVKAPGVDSFTYPHQDWTFVDAPPFVSITVWIALVATDEANGALGFVPGSHQWFEAPVGSPSPDFQTCTQGHEALLYEYLQLVPLQAGEAVAFDNRTIHGATPNRSEAPRTAVAVGMTPAEAPLFHHVLMPGPQPNGRRTIVKLSVDPEFFVRHSVSSLKRTFDQQRLPDGATVAATLQDDFLPYSADEIRRLCEQAGLPRNGRRLERSNTARDQRAAFSHRRASLGSVVGRIWKSIVRA